jgi:hypothetical protein
LGCFLSSSRLTKKSRVLMILSRSAQAAKVHLIVDDKGGVIDRVAVIGFDRCTIP